MAIAGLGTDIVEIVRLGKDEGAMLRLAKRVLTPSELQQFEQHRTPQRFLAKRFAAKEAVAKALATPESGALSWHDVEVVNDPSGRPRAILHGGAQDRLDSIIPEGCVATVHLTLSDERDFAVAFAVVEARPA